MPEVHGAGKSLDTYVRPGKQKTLPSLPIHNIDRRQPTHPIPKPRIGQGTARLKRKVKMNQPMPSSQQTPAQPMVTHVPKTALSLPESIIQSHVQPQHIPIPFTQPHQPIDPTCIIQQIGPKIQHRPSPPYHDQYARPPPNPP